MSSIVSGAYVASQQLAGQASANGPHVLELERAMIAQIPSAWFGRISTQDAAETIQG